MENIKINAFEIENLKRVRAVRLEPAENGLTVIGGRNGQGKTSVLDAIAWALGGDKYRPSEPQRDGSVVPPSIHITLSNGLIVERKGKNGDLKVTDPNGRRGGQQLLNDFIEQFALDLPKFMQSPARDKAATLLRIIGVGDKLDELERREKELYNTRRTVGQIADQKAKFAKEMPSYPNLPDEPISPSELIRRQQDILARNGRRETWKREQERITYDIKQTQNAIAETEAKLYALRAALAELQEKEQEAQKSPEEMAMESTAELEADIGNIEKTNIKIRANLDHEKAEDDAKQYAEKYTALTQEIENTRSEKTRLLDNAPLPLQGLSVADGELTYNGMKWDCMSGAEQLRVSTAIVRKLNPACGFVLLDRLEQMDSDTLREFGAWLEGEGLQAIATRVSVGDECSIIITDGYIDGRPSTQNQPDAKPIKKAWEVGKF